MRTVISAMALVFLSISPALAVDTAKTYSSGVLVSIFLGFCALIVIAQAVPALMLLLGAIKAFATRKAREEIPATESIRNDS